MNWINREKGEINEKSLRKTLQEGREEGVVTFYTQYRKEFFHWARHNYQLDTDSCADVFQEAVIRFFIQAKQGKLGQLKCSTKTYLFAIGKNMILKHLHKEKQAIPRMEAVAAAAGEVYENPEEPEQQNERLVMQVLEKLGEPCRSILRLFYFKACSMAEIAHELHYKNENVVKSQKLRCLNEVKRQVKECLQKQL